MLYSYRNVPNWSPELFQSRGCGWLGKRTYWYQGPMRLYSNIVRTTLSSDQGAPVKFLNIFTQFRSIGVDRGKIELTCTLFWQCRRILNGRGEIVLNSGQFLLRSWPKRTQLLYECSMTFLRLSKTTVLFVICTGYSFVCFEIKSLVLRHSWFKPNSSPFFIQLDRMRSAIMARGIVLWSWEVLVMLYSNPRANASSLDRIITISLRPFKIPLQCQ